MFSTQQVYHRAVAFGSPSLAFKCQSLSEASVQLTGVRRRARELFLFGGKGHFQELALIPLYQADL